MNTTTHQTRTLGQRHAFTLIELLVVISIIALLISILLPALSSTRRSARRVQCATALNQVGTAAASYAADHKGLIPEPFDTNYPYEARMALRSGDGRGIGELYGKDYIQTPEIFYCPSQTDEKMQFGYYTSADGSWGYPAGDWALRITYMWNPNVDTNRDLLFKRLDQMKPDTLLALDTVEQLARAAHPDARGFNVLRADNSVKFEAKEEAWSQFISAGVVDNNWTVWNGVVDRLLGEFPEGRNN